MTKLWYEIKKRFKDAEIDTTCDLCKNSLESLERHGIDANQVLVIAPDVNAFGVVTKYHIGRTTRKQIKGSKLYEDLERET